MDPTSEVYPPYRLVAEFMDGSRLLFDGLTEQQAMDALDLRSNRILPFFLHGCNVSSQQGIFMFSQQFFIVIIRPKLLCHIHDPFQMRQF